MFFNPFRMIIRFLRDFTLIFVFGNSRSTSGTNYVEVMEEATEICNQNQVMQAYCEVKLCRVEKIELVEQEDDFQEFPVLDHEEESVEEPSSSSNNSPARSSDLNHQYPQSVTQGDEDQDSADAFYKKYTERMRWFDILNYDRTCGISMDYKVKVNVHIYYTNLIKFLLIFIFLCYFPGAVLNRQVGAPSPIESNINSDQDFAIPSISWAKMTKKRLLKSLESDFEMVYVAQSCLSWEALHYQYTKVKSLADSTSQNNGVFPGNLHGEFQKFQVLLERFLEDESCGGKRIWNYVRGRFGLNSLLQVPQISGN